MISRNDNGTVDFGDNSVYFKLVDEFSAYTNIKHPVSGVCCSDIDKHGAPKCCYTLTDGTCKLTFTGREMEALAPLLDPKRDGVMFSMNLAQSYWTATCKDPAKMRQSLKDGFLARTLECASHPTRPVLDERGNVIGVVAVEDCISEYAFDQLRENYADLLKLWRNAVNLYGVKPYYIIGEVPERFKVIA